MTSATTSAGGLASPGADKDLDAGNIAHFTRALHPFDEELRWLRSTSIGSLKDLIRDGHSRLRRRVRRDGLSAGSAASERFLGSLIPALDSEPRRRDQERPL